MKFRINCTLHWRKIYIITRIKKHTYFGGPGGVTLSHITPWNMCHWIVGKFRDMTWSVSHAWTEHGICIIHSGRTLADFTVSDGLYGKLFPKWLSKYGFGFTKDYDIFFQCDAHCFEDMILSFHAFMNPPEALVECVGSTAAIVIW